jgi:hypothetical protein
MGKGRFSRRFSPCGEERTMRKKELLILTAVITALVFYLFFHDRNQTRYDLPDLPGISGGDIDRIEIQRAGKTLTVEKRENRWVVGGKGYPADSDKVRDMQRMLENLTLTTLISESENYTRYELDETNRISIQAWKQKMKLRDFSIGKPAATYRHTHILLAGDPKVYHAQGDLRRVFSQEEENILDKTVLDFRAEEIQELKIQEQNRSVLLKRTETAGNEKTVKTDSGAEVKPAAETFWVSSHGERVDFSNVLALLRFLSGLPCEKYVDTGMEGGVPEIVLTLKGSTDHRLEIYSPKTGPEKSYPGKSSRTPFSFLVEERRIESLKEKIHLIFTGVESWNSAPQEK